MSYDDDIVSNIRIRAVDETGDVSKENALGRFRQAGNVDIGYG